MNGTNQSSITTIINGAWKLTNSCHAPFPDAFCNKQQVLFFVDLFATHMFNRNLIELYCFDIRCYLGIYFFFCWIIFFSKLSYLCFCNPTIFNQMASAKYNHTLQIRCPVTFFMLFISIDCKTYFIILFQRIYFVSRFRSMKINLFTLRFIKIINRKCKWIPVIPIYCQTARFSCNSQFLCIFLLKSYVSFLSRLV